MVKTYSFKCPLCGKDDWNKVEIIFSMVLDASVCTQCFMSEGFQTKALALKQQQRAMKIEADYQKSITNGSMNRPGGDKFDGLD